MESWEGGDQIKKKKKKIRSKMESWEGGGSDQKKKKIVPN